ncbi:MAG: DegT/DnrJ/EryC1/StrS aminotransferase family protein [Gemmatimonadaceae bacterium]|nr:DegT/DnrJ/EryC1/StrS aminotransferase family protein [Gemmatimonadaceae bacterium]
MALALRLSGVRSASNSPRVALPAYGCPDLLSAALFSGHRVVLYDLDPQTLEPELQSLRHALALGCSHVVVTHLYGRIVDLEAVMHEAKRTGAQVIEDAAQHAGGSLDGVRGGGQADWGVLSFGRGKGINAGGGGALLIPQMESAASLEALGVTPAVSGMLGLARVAATEVLSHPLWFGMVKTMPGLGVGATEFHPLSGIHVAPLTACTLLLDALAQESTLLRHRREVASYYRDALQRFPDVLFAPTASDEEQGALRFPIKLHTPPDRELEHLGVVQSYPRTLADYPQIADVLDNPSHAWPGARQLARSVFTLPTHSRISSTVQRAIVNRLIALVSVSS